MSKSYEHEIKRDNGDKIIIRVSYADWCDRFKLTNIGVIPKRKRNVQYIEFTNNYDYRCLSSTEKDKYAVEKYLEVVSLEEIREATLKAWENMKPTVENLENLYAMV
jgi:hypothetical protein